MFEYFNGSGLLHRLDVRTKAVGFLMMLVLTFIFKSPLINLCLVILSVSLAVYSGIRLETILGKLKPLVTIFIFVILMSSLSYSPGWFETPTAQRVLFSWFNSGVFLTAGGFLYGLTLLFRIIMMIVITSVFVSCTPLDDFFQLLQKMAMPYQLAFVLTTAIRFIPTMERKAWTILDAQNSRGAQIGCGNPVRRIYSYLSAVIPLMTEAIRMSENLAVGMLNRGYGARARATRLREIQLKNTDYFLIAVFLMVTALGIYLSWAGFGRL